MNRELYTAGSNANDAGVQDTSGRITAVGNVEQILHDREHSHLALHKF